MRVGQPNEHRSTTCACEGVNGVNICFFDYVFRLSPDSISSSQSALRLAQKTERLRRKLTLLTPSYAHAILPCSCDYFIQTRGIARKAPGAADSRRRFGEDGDGTE